MPKLNPAKPTQGNILSKSPILGRVKSPQKKTSLDQPTGMKALMTTSVRMSTVTTGLSVTGLTAPRSTASVVTHKITTGITATSITTPKTLTGGAMAKVTGIAGGAGVVTTGMKIAAATTPKAPKIVTGIASTLKPMTAIATGMTVQEAISRGAIGEAWQYKAPKTPVRTAGLTKL